MEREIVEKYLEAGKIAKKARVYGISIIKSGSLHLDIVSKVEEKIREFGGELACPVTISVNETAAHDTADTNDNRVINTGDVVKLDMGVQVDGYIADTAETVEVGTSENAKLIEASREAVTAAISAVKEGKTIGVRKENKITAELQTLLSEFNIPVKFIEYDNYEYAYAGNSYTCLSWNDRGF